MNFFEKLEPRERILVFIGCILIVILVFSFGIKKISDFRESLVEKLDESNSAFLILDKIIENYNYYRNLEKGKTEENISRVYGKIDEILLKYNLKDKVSNMKDTSSTIKNKFNKTTISLNFNSVSIKEVIKFIYEIEKNKAIDGKIDYLNFRKPFVNKEVFDVQIKVSMYSALNKGK